MSLVANVVEPILTLKLPGRTYRLLVRLLFMNYSAEMRLGLRLEEQWLCFVHAETQSTLLAVVTPLKIVMHSRYRLFDLLCCLFLSSITVRMETRKIEFSLQPSIGSCYGWRAFSVREQLFERYLETLLLPYPTQVILSYWSFVAWITKKFWMCDIWNSESDGWFWPYFFALRVRIHFCVNLDHICSYRESARTCENANILFWLLKKTVISYLYCMRYRSETQGLLNFSYIPWDVLRSIVR